MALLDLQGIEHTADAEFVTDSNQSNNCSDASYTLC